MWERLLKDIKEDESLPDIRALLEEHLYTKNSIVQERDLDGFFHPSSLGGCLRRLWYAFMYTQPEHRIPLKLRFCFEHGHSVHDWMQSQLIAALEKIDGLDIYCEISIRDRKWVLPDSYAFRNNLAGSTDGLIVMQQDGVEKRAIYELKTASVSVWDKLTKPNPKHIEQASVYAECFGAEDIIFQYYNKNTDLSKFFYVKKDPTRLEEISRTLGTIMGLANDGKSPAKKYNKWECSTCPYYYTCRPEI
mgnify:CR=1 FL=1